MTDAEDIVFDAWVTMLMEHRDRMRNEVRAALTHCETIQRVLGAALVERRPEGIAVAQADLECALSTARAAEQFHALACQALTLALDRLAWRHTERTVGARYVRTVSTGTDTDGRGRPNGLRGSASVRVRLNRRLMPWILYVAVNFTQGRARS